MPVYSLEVAVVLLGLVLLMMEAFVAGKDKRFVAHTALLGLGAVLVGSFFVDRTPDASGFWSFYKADGLAMTYKAIALACTMLVIVLGLDYIPVLEKFTARVGGHGAWGEFFCLPVFICAGMMWMASASDLTSIFVSLELVTIAFYVMVTFMRRNVGSLEAGVKYLILGALSTGFLVYGFTWLFGVTGQTNLDVIAAKLNSGTVATVPAMFSFALILVALAFKIGAVPLQFWIPDVYQGAPTPITAYLSVGSKAAGFIVTTRILQVFLGSEALVHNCTAILLAVACATLLVGNLAAIPQTNFKRLLAYSSISHAGFLVLALAAGPAGAFGLAPGQIVAYYLAAYLIMTLLAFAVLVVINRTSGSDDLNAFNGLHQRSPFLAFALLVAVASLAGVPLTVGFVGKLLVFAAAVKASLWLPLGFAIIGAVAGFYYYLKVLRNMYWNAPAGGTLPAITLSGLTKATLLLLIAATVVLGVWWAPLFQLVRR
ncbi:MAG: NADH-quinone oxidoreductase subunit [Verrucomicrobiales bacterium]|nr:NADH-quinone oxidoreductase subunit [Verrucomicrobiales bacterium]